MKPFWKYFTGIVTGFLASATVYITTSDMEMNTKPHAPEPEPYKIEESVVRSHSARKLSFDRHTEFFDEGDYSEISFCYPVRSRGDFFMIAKKWKEGGYKEIVNPESACAKCHPRYKKRLPLPPDAPVEVG